MSLGAALRDQARQLARRATQQKVEGRTVMVAPIAGAWFRARLDYGGQSGASEDRGGVRRAVEMPTLLFGNRDKAGASLTRDDGGCVIRANDFVEVASRELGNAVFQVSGEPKPLRKRQRIIGYLANVSRLDYDPFERRPGMASGVLGGGADARDVGGGLRG